MESASMGKSVLPAWSRELLRIAGIFVAAWKNQRLRERIDVAGLITVWPHELFFELVGSVFFALAVNLKKILLRKLSDVRERKRRIVRLIPLSTVCLKHWLQANRTDFSANRCTFSLPVRFSADISSLNSLRSICQHLNYGQ